MRRLIQNVGAPLAGLMLLFHGSEQAEAAYDSTASDFGSTSSWISGGEPSVGSVSLPTMGPPLLQSSFPPGTFPEPAPSGAVLGHGRPSGSSGFLDIPTLGLPSDPLAVSVPSVVGAHGYPGGGNASNISVVSNTKIPVGFHESEDGTYLAPRFPTTVQTPLEVPADASLRCVRDTPVTEITNGHSATLKSGGIAVYGNARKQLLKILGTSYPRFTSKLPSAAIGVIWERLNGRRLLYEIAVKITPGCVYIPEDPVARALVVRSGEYITRARIRVRAEQFVLHEPSFVPVPKEILTLVGMLPPNSNFVPVGHCVYAAHFVANGEQLQVTSSSVSLRVDVTSENGEEALQMRIPEGCVPLMAHRTAVWVVPAVTGSVVIAAFSPPPEAVSQRWTMLPTTGDASEFEGRSVTSVV